MQFLDEELKYRERLSLFEGLTSSPYHFREYGAVFLKALLRPSPRDAGNLLGSATHN